MGGWHIVRLPRVGEELCRVVLYKKRTNDLPRTLRHTLTIETRRRREKAGRDGMYSSHRAESDVYIT